MRNAHTSNHKTPFGLKDGRMVSTKEVDSGLACGCTCVGCGGQLIAKKGAKKAWHFAHYEVATTMDCVESAIHAAAKQILLEENWLWVPAVYIQSKGHTRYGAHTKTRTLSEARIIRFEHSKEEVWEAGANVRPDVVGYRSDRRLLVEMYFTHKVDEIKRKKLEILALPAVEIDLSNLGVDASFDDIRERVLGDAPLKEWLFYPGLAEAQAALDAEVAADVERLNQENDERLKADERRAEAERHEAERV